MLASFVPGLMIVARSRWTGGWPCHRRRGQGTPDARGSAGQLSVTVRVRGAASYGWATRIEQLKHVVVVGAGPAGLMAADVISAAGHRVTVKERMPNVGRKLLMAGRGGLNLTHSEDLEALLTRYGAARAWLELAIRGYGPADLTGFAEALGQETFVGTSGRVFPKAMKASPLLRAWLAKLAAQGVVIVPRQRWVGFDAAGRPGIALAIT